MGIFTLDCTLRDGGYVNNWNFREKHIMSILENLTIANIDFVECGYLNQNAIFNSDKTVYQNLTDIQKLLPVERGNTKYVCMINYGEYDSSKIPYCDGKSVVGFRVVFHKKDWKDALDFCAQIQDKGYLIFVQPMMTVSYSDKELLVLLEGVNHLNPFACYIVDSFGVMKRSDLLRLSYLFDFNLNKEIVMGYHAHNNLQLAFSNAQSFVEINTKRDRLIDSSVYGIGRGAGNLNTELFIQFLNDINDSNYKINPLLKIIDESISTIYQENYWGYSMPHYLSAVYYCHPNYASYLAQKNTLTVDGLKNIISSISEEKKNTFDKKYIEKMYINYQRSFQYDESTADELALMFNQKKILLVGPGKSSIKYSTNITEYLEKNKPIIISVNHNSKLIKSDYLFYSNRKRYENAKTEELNCNIITTSNISRKRGYTVDYESLLKKDDEMIADNALIMALNLLIKLGVTEVDLIGFDGYSYNHNDNFVDIELSLPMDKRTIEQLNYKINCELAEISKILEVNFITPSAYQKI